MPSCGHKKERKEELANVKFGFESFELFEEEIYQALVCNSCCSTQALMCENLCKFYCASVTAAVFFYGYLLYSGELPAGAK